MRTLGILAMYALVRVAPAAEILLPPGGPIQPAIDAAADGDVVVLSAGEYPGDIDLRGKAITIRGVGAATVLRGTGTTSVVRIATGEGPATTLGSLTITGGSAPSGGGILVDRASPTLLRLVVQDNAAIATGSGIMLEQSDALVANTLLVGNHSAGGDPHTLQGNGGAPRVVNNTIVEGDSNGILVRGGTALITNNIIAHNGSRPVFDEARGRGICDFSGGRAQIRYNLFFRNQVGALLAGGRDWRRAEQPQRLLALPNLIGNRDGSPGFDGGRRTDYTLRPGARAEHIGDPDPGFANQDGSRNTVGHTGGPLAR